MKQFDNHYKYLDEALALFLTALGFDPNSWLYNAQGLISAHGDKAYSHRDEWEKAGISFGHGVAIYLLTHIKPYSEEVRTTKKGWVDPCRWIIANYSQFKDILEEIDEKL